MRPKRNTPPGCFPYSCSALKHSPALLGYNEALCIVAAVFVQLVLCYCCYLDEPRLSFHQGQAAGLLYPLCTVLPYKLDQCARSAS